MAPAPVDRKASFLSLKRAPFQLTALDSTHVILPIDGGYYAQGTSEDGKDLLGYDLSGWHNLGNIQVGEQNSGACVNDPKQRLSENEQACYAWTGNIEYKKSNLSVWPDIIVHSYGSSDGTDLRKRSWTDIYKFTQGGYQKQSNRGSKPEVAGYIGVQARAAGLGNEGALIFSVVPNGPAFTAGLRPGDVITQVNGREVPNAIILRSCIAPLEPGDTAVISFIRHGEMQSASVVLSEIPR